MTSKDAVMSAIGVLDVDGLHLPERPIVPITGAIRHVGGMRQVSESVVVKSQSAGYPSSFTAAH